MNSKLKKRKLKRRLLLMLFVLIVVFNIAIANTTAKVFNHEVQNAEFIGIVKIIDENKVFLSTGYYCGKKVKVKVIYEIKNSILIDDYIWVVGETNVDQNYIVFVMKSQDIINSISDEFKKKNSLSSYFINGDPYEKCLNVMPKLIANADGISDFLLEKNSEYSKVYFKKQYIFLNKRTSQRIIEKDERGYQFTSLDDFIRMIKTINGN